MTPSKGIDRRLDALHDEAPSVSFDRLFRFDSPLNRRLAVRQWRAEHGDD